MLLLLCSAAGIAWSLLLPIYAKDVLLSGATGWAMLIAGLSAGGLCGTLVAAAAIRSRGASIQIFSAVAAGMGIALIAFMFSRRFELSLGLLFVGAFAAGIALNGAAGTKQGRAIAELWHDSGVLAPLIALGFAFITDRFGAQMSLIGAGVIVVLASGCATLLLSRFSGLPRSIESTPPQVDDVATP